MPARLFAGSLERLARRMLALGATEEDLTAARRLLSDPRVTYRGVTLTIAWARTWARKLTSLPRRRAGVIPGFWQLVWRRTAPQRTLV